MQLNEHCKVALYFIFIGYVIYIHLPFVVFMAYKAIVEAFL